MNPLHLEGLYSRGVRRLPWLLIAVALAMVTGACTEPTQFEPLAEMRVQRVVIESVDFDGVLWEPLRPLQGEIVQVSGTLRIPATAEPVPAVLIAHGCGGVTSVSRAWARDLAEAGMATLLLESFASRDIPELCTGQHTISIASLLHDAYRGLDFLAASPFVDESSIVILGISFGGRTALWTSYEKFEQEYGSNLSFAAHLALYPSGCYIELADEQPARDVPVRIFHGLADDWLPAYQCMEYVDRLDALGHDIGLFAYDDAHHGFDDVTLAAYGPMHLPHALSPRNCRFAERDGRVVDVDTGELATVATECVERGVTIAFDAEARANAVEDMLSFLESVLRSS